MPVTIKVNGKSNSLVHKGSNGIAKNTVPDVCKTPSPGGPVPIPYPVIVSMSRDLAKGTKTVKVDGGNMAAIKGSQFSRCMGDEPGTAGGVKSSTNMKEATWITSSFDVKLDGKGACRLSDKMQMNHGNTVCLGGESQAPVVAVEDLEPPGDCTQEVYDVLNKEVAESKSACGALKRTFGSGRCEPNDSPTIRSQKAAAWERQALARNHRDGKCFRGGDDGHQKQAAECWNHVSKCVALGI